ncbi:LytTR family DNA-binding domain-containing protein [Marivita sp. S2033]|uniref:LytTR family DNA-binding domain-containing protein n=1 Tax=Marivita sp. S2033 TaxID=3373187 RepID=UPI003981B760
MPAWFAVLMWPMAAGAYLGLYFALLLLVSAISGFLPRLRVPLPVLGAAALLPTVYLCEAAVVAVSNGAYDEDIVPKLLFFFLTVQATETVFFKFIMPSVRAELSDNAQGRFLIIDGERIDLAQILHIEAREHHVQLTFADTSKRLRARLRDIVAQTQDEDGFQPHRSWWVARDPTITTLQKDGRMVLRLRDDTEVPVARTRVADVQSWLETHLDRSG